MPLAIVDSVEEIQKGVFLLKALCPEIAEQGKPGQFCNIKVNDNITPLLRRPFSISDVYQDFIYFMFDIHGEGTKILSNKKANDKLDLLGPLGNGFNLNDDFETAIFIAGGLGTAPFPFLKRKLNGKKSISFIGGRSENNVISYNLENTNIATDDGSLGFHGNVVQLFEKKLKENNFKKIKIFACGPNPMLKALQKLCAGTEVNCELSTECAMACGFGICQGCPMLKADGSGYLLVCKDGPVFKANEIKL